MLFTPMTSNDLPFCIYPPSFALTAVVWISVRHSISIHSPAQPPLITYNIMNSTFTRLRRQPTEARRFDNKNTLNTNIFIARGIPKR